MNIAGIRSRTTTRTASPAASEWSREDRERKPAICGGRQVKGGNAARGRHRKPSVSRAAPVCCSSHIAGETELRPFRGAESGRDRRLYFGGQDPQVFREPGEEFPLPGIGRQIPDKRALGGVGTRFSRCIFMSRMMEFPHREPTYLAQLELPQMLSPARFAHRGGATEGLVSCASSWPWVRRPPSFRSLAYLLLSLLSKPANVPC